MTIWEGKYLFRTLLFFFIFRPIYSIMNLLILAIMLGGEYKKKKYNILISWGIIFLVGISVFEPVISYFAVTNGAYNKRSIGVIESYDKRNMDYYTFQYKNKMIDTSTDSIYPVGNTYDYFVIYNLKTDKTMIYPKSECENICIKPMKLFR